MIIEVSHSENHAALVSFLLHHRGVGLWYGKWPSGEVYASVLGTRDYAVT